MPAATEWLNWLERKGADAFPRHRLRTGQLAAVATLPPLIILGFESVDLVWRVLAWVAWFAASTSLAVVALLDWSRSTGTTDSGLLALVRSIARASLALLGIAGAICGLWILARMATDLMAGRASPGLFGLGVLVGISALCTGVQMVLLPYTRD